MEPASATSNMLYCAPDTEEEIKGTGVHALRNYDKGQLGKVCEIGKQARRKGAWEETIGTDVREQSEQAPSQKPQCPRHPSEYSAPPGIDRTSESHSPNVNTRQAELMEHDAGN